MTAEQIDLIERIAARAPELASDVRILIDEVNRLRSELNQTDTHAHWTGDRERAVKD